MKQAKIECPHCGTVIIVRQREGDLAPEKAAKIFGEINKMFKAVSASFERIFHPSLWK